MTVKTKPQVPISLYGVLDHTVNSLFGEDFHLRVFIQHSMARGFIRVGDIIQKTEEEYFAIVPTSEANKVRLANSLRLVGLTFGMEAPGWNRPTAQRGTQSTSDLALR